MRKVPKIAAEIARPLLAAGRAEDALRTIEAAEEKALEHAQAFPSSLQALHFLVSWPALRAARLVVDHPGESDSDHYELLIPAADPRRRQVPAGGHAAASGDD